MNTKYFLMVLLAGSCMILCNKSSDQSNMQNTSPAPVDTMALLRDSTALKPSFIIPEDQLITMPDKRSAKYREANPDINIKVFKAQTEQYDERVKRAQKIHEIQQMQMKKNLKGND